MVLDARCTTLVPPTRFELKLLEEHELNLAAEAAQIEAALDEQLENLEEANSGSETVNDYFTYSPAYHHQQTAACLPEKATYLNVQTLPQNAKSAAMDDALR